MTPGGVFVDATVSRLPAASIGDSACSMIDLDSDGDLDVVMVGYDLQGWSTRVMVYTNLYRQVDIPTPARIGATMSIDVYATPGFGTYFQAALPWLSFGLLQPPVCLQPFGCFRLDPSTLVAGPLLHIPPSTGKASLSLPIANDPALVGMRFHVQAGMLPTTQPQDWRFSNLARESVRR